jgi:hypothetical protein
MKIELSHYPMSHYTTSIDVYDSRIKSEMFKGSIKLNLEFGTIILSLYLSTVYEVHSETYQT